MALSCHWCIFQLCSPVLCLDHTFFYLYSVVPLSNCEVLPCHLFVKSKLFFASMFPGFDLTRVFDFI